MLPCHHAKFTLMHQTIGHTILPKKIMTRKRNFFDTYQHGFQDKVEIQIQNPLAMGIQPRKKSLINENESCTMNKNFGHPIHNLRHIHTTMQ